MDYKALIDKLSESRHLISMTPIDRLIELGYAAGMDETTSVLDLCCGYGKMLSLWHEAFGIRGVGVDLCADFIREGRALLAAKRIEAVKLICADAAQWQTEEKFDFACLSGEDFGGFRGTIHLLEKHLNPHGRLILGTRYAKTDHPPQALIDFEGETLSLMQMHRIVREEGWYITGMATDTAAEWERYIMWSARRNLDALRRSPDSPDLQAWCETWYDTYFSFRRQHEGYVTLVLEKL